MDLDEPKSWRDRVADAAKSAAKAASSAVDPDIALQASMAGMVELAATRYALEPGAQYEPGKPLKLLFAGYSGTRNTGADVRVEEMLRQVRHLLGDDLAELSITTIDPTLTRGYFKTVKQLVLPKIFPRFVFDSVHEHHGVLACEGSMFKSKFANALSTYMVGALGCAAVENKIAVGYGGEAGAMDPSLEALVKRYLRDALVICRNKNSERVLGDLGVPTRAGTDTAWTFEPAPPAVGEAWLTKHGWDGTTPVVAICPINPFWWPVKPDVVKGAARALTGAWSRSHYSSVYFHHDGPDVDKKQAAYLDAIAEGLRRFRKETKVFPILVGMEQLDRYAIEALVERTGPLPMLISDEHDMYEMVSVLRRCSYLLSSRYHAIVCSMPGSVASAGITMDERIANLMIDRGTPQLSLTVDDPMLASKVHQTLAYLHANKAEVQEGIERCVVRNTRVMGQMGQILVDHLRERHPDMPLRKELGEHGDPWAHLPSLGSQTQALVERFA